MRKAMILMVLLLGASMLGASLAYGQALDPQQKALRKAIDDVGWAGVCLWNERTKRLIDGHGRKKIIRPGEMAPVVIGSWSPEDEEKILLTLDPLASMATQDSQLLATLLKSRIAAGDDLIPLVWPDYVIEPLLGADWSPPAVGELPGRDEEPRGFRTITFTEEQWGTIEQAVAKVQQGADGEITSQRGIELMAADFLAGH